jgi:hypothetical protein
MRLNLTRSRVAAVALVAGVVPALAITVVEAAEPETVDQVRTRLLGAGWNDPDEIRARSIGNTTWLVSYGGTLVVHDSTIEDQLTDTGAAANTNGYLSLDDVIAAKPAAILQDHTHFDQQHSAVELAASGIPLVIDLGGCIWTKQTAIEKGVDPNAINCNLIRDVLGRPFFTTDTTLPAGLQGVDLGLNGTLGGALDQLGLNGVLGGVVNEDVQLSDLLTFTDYGTKGWPEIEIAGGLSTMAIQIKHSPSFTGRPYPNSLSGPNIDLVGSLQNTIEDWTAEGVSAAEIAENVYATYAPLDLEGANVGWLVKYREFSLFHHGSSGPTYGLEPGAEKIRRVLETLSDWDRVDLEIGGLAEVNYIQDGNYFADAKNYAGAIGAKRYFPTHHYNWYPVWLTNPAVAYWPGMSETWVDGGQQFGANFPKMCYLTEDNYATLWRMKASQWRGTRAGTIEPMTGPGCYTG